MVNMYPLPSLLGHFGAPKVSMHVLAKLPDTPFRGTKGFRERNANLCYPNTAKFHSPYSIALVDCTLVYHLISALCASRHPCRNERAAKITFINKELGKTSSMKCNSPCRAMGIQKLDIARSANGELGPKGCLIYLSVYLLSRKWSITQEREICLKPSQHLLPISCALSGLSWVDVMMSTIWNQRIN